jgi:hypothetical protein
MSASPGRASHPLIPQVVHGRLRGWRLGDGAVWSCQKFGAADADEKCVSHGAAGLMTSGGDRSAELRMENRRSRRSRSTSTAGSSTL